jgi:hypothetical protein
VRYVDLNDIHKVDDDFMFDSRWNEDQPSSNDDILSREGSPNKNATRDNAAVGAAESPSFSPEVWRMSILNLMKQVEDTFRDMRNNYTKKDVLKLLVQPTSDVKDVETSVSRELYRLIDGHT